VNKDPFQILADEITLIRSEIEKLQRTSLDKDEAKALHDHVAASVAELRKAAPALEASIDRKMTSAMAVIKDNTATAADESAKGAVIGAHAESVKAAKMLLKDAQEARKQAWRTFGNFWAWIIASGALCACVGILGFMLIQGRGDAFAFIDNAEGYCEPTGNLDTVYNDGRRGCMVWYDRQ